MTNTRDVFFLYGRQEDETEWQPIAFAFSQAGLDRYMDGGFYHYKITHGTLSEEITLDEDA